MTDTVTPIKIDKELRKEQRREHLRSAKTKTKASAAKVRETSIKAALNTVGAVINFAQENTVGTYHRHQARRHMLDRYYSEHLAFRKESMAAWRKAADKN